MTASPCIGVCELDGNTQRCVGCGRTMDEIAAWSSLTDTERREILARLERSRRSTTAS
ncbi:MAG TPA: DUF1289 domain-containing protein [Alphaproteobacteria bacterium]